MKNKQLKRSNINKILFGVMGGLSEYFEIDAVVARLIFVVLLVVTGFFPFATIYLIAVVIMSEDNKREHTEVKYKVREEEKEEVKQESEIK